MAHTCCPIIFLLFHFYILVSPYGWQAASLAVGMCMRACMFVCVHRCERSCVHVCVCASVRACMRVCVYTNDIAAAAKWLRAWDTLTMFEATVCGRS